MSFYLIGLGLNIKSISLEAVEKLKKCDEIYLETYTINFPYEINDLEKELKISVKKINRENVENEFFLSKAKEKNIALLVYGDPLSATTHHQLILYCIKKEIKYEIIHNASIINVLAESGLSLYKFGKISSIPKWTKNFKPTSFADYIKDNLSIKAHSLILIDIDLDFLEALEELKIGCKEKKIKFEKLVILSSLGTKEQKIFYININDSKIKSNIKKPFSFIIHSDLNFFEKEFLESITIN